MKTHEINLSKVIRWKIKINEMNFPKWLDSKCVPKGGWVFWTSPLSLFIYWMN